jgi:hypothetical protein
MISFQTKGDFYAEQLPILINQFLTINDAIGEEYIGLPQTA